MQREAEQFPVYGSYDAIVSGGGLTGAVCATALARAGGKVALIERRSALGWEIGRARRVFADLEQAAAFSSYIGDLLQGLRQKSSYRDGAMNASFAELVLDTWILDAGVDVLFHGWVSQLWERDGAVRGLVVGTKEGYQRLDAPVIIETDDIGRLIRPDYDRVSLQPQAFRSFMVCDCEPGEGAEYALPDGRKVTVRPLGGGQARVDIALSAGTVEERDRQFFADVRDALAVIRAAGDGMASAKVVFLSEEEWRPPGFRLSDERLYRKEDAPVGSLLARDSGPGRWKPRSLSAGQLAVPDRQGVMYAGPWLPASLELSDSEEAALLNRMLLGEAAAVFAARTASSAV